MISAHAGDLLAQAEALLQSRNPEAAWAAYRSAQAAGADMDSCSAGRWMAAILEGRFEAAWRESDAIRTRAAEDPHRFWQGEDFHEKRVMLRCLHGCGDTVQMMRYAPLIRAQATHLVVEAAPAMVELIALFDGPDEVITWGALAPEKPPEWDVQMEVNELPYIFRTQENDLPLSTRYLKLPTSLLDAVEVQPHMPESLRVGMVWASGEWNPSRSVPLKLLEPLLATPGAEFWNLQGGVARAQWESLSPSPRLHPAEECAGSIAQLAALVHHLDLVITPDTLAAHLAGALGRPAWLLLEHAADWRWQHERSDSPWYPSLRLFRQPMPLDWVSPVATLQSELNALARSRANERRVA